MELIRAVLITCNKCMKPTTHDEIQQHIFKCRKCGTTKEIKTK